MRKNRAELELVKGMLTNFEIKYMIAPVSKLKHTKYAPLPPLFSSSASSCSCECDSKSEVMLDLLRSVDKNLSNLTSLVEVLIIYEVNKQVATSRNINTSIANLHLDKYIK
jgi:hypothetical protein